MEKCKECSNTKFVYAEYYSDETQVMYYIKTPCPVCCADSVEFDTDELDEEG